MFAFGLDSIIDGRYSHLAAANSVAGFETPYIELVPRHAPKACFLLPVAHNSMVAQAEQPSGWPDSNLTGSLNPVWAATNELETSGGSDNFLKLEAATMATIPTQVTTVETLEPNVFEHNGKILTTSLAVAEYFHKTHDNVLKKIRSIMADCEENYRLVNFNETSYTRENPNGGLVFPLSCLNSPVTPSC